jgi:signal peptidase
MEKNKKGKVSRIAKGVVIVILSIILIMNVYVFIQTKTKPNSVPSLFGYKPFIVLSGSMENEIYVGDLVIVKEVDPKTLQVNDIIAFRDSENYVTTHRIINVVNTDKGKCFETKGDANNTKDNDIVCSDSIEGKYSSKIHAIGNAILFIQQPLGFAVMMLSIFIICILIFFISNRKINQKITDEELKEFEEFKKLKKQEKKDK